MSSFFPQVSTFNVHFMLPHDFCGGEGIAQLLRLSKVRRFSFLMKPLEALTEETLCSDEVCENCGKQASKWTLTSIINF